VRTAQAVSLEGCRHGPFEARADARAPQGDE